MISILLIFIESLITRFKTRIVSLISTIGKLYTAALKNDFRILNGAKFLGSRLSAKINLTVFMSLMYLTNSIWHIRLHPHCNEETLAYVMQLLKTNQPIDQVFLGVLEITQENFNKP